VIPGRPNRTTVLGPPAGCADSIAEIDANGQPGWTVGSVNTLCDLNGGVIASGLPVPVGITASPSPS
jgi:hypothetical protein